ncbi:MAG: hybrid sensor histidine kinase/response regulator [Acidobacteria bacterium]|nr:MAG: hybrid sensor histidine kinase/response regulator [Acidobacteriota bacterium]
MAGDPYQYFRIEAREILEQLGQGALDLEKGIPSSDVIARLLRLAHTLKGAARVVKQPEIAEHAHKLEDVFTTLRNSTASAPREQIDLVLMLLDQIGVRLGALAAGGPADAVLPGRFETEEAVHVYRPDSQDMEGLVDGVAEAQSQLAALRLRLDRGDRIRHLIDLIDDQVGRFRVADAVRAGNRPGVEKTLSMIEELRGGFGALERDVAHGVEQIERELRQVSEAAARLRLVPTSAVFRFLERAARDVGRTLGKRVTFEGRGGDVRVDSGILTIVQGALLQVVRNAVAHGIESSDNERRAAGKPPDGHVTVTVSRRGASVSFVCSDDGRGIDLDAVRRTLQRKGLSPAERQALDADALLRLLLKGGISTSRTVTDVAGRGIGLDVVREAAERLGGDVTMRTEPGTGTTIELLVPFSIASLPALVVEVAGIAAAVPLDSVRRTLRVTSGQITETADATSILHDGRSIPFSSLLRVVRPAEPRPRAAGASPTFIVEAGGGAAAFAVDRILGTATVVTRPLPELAPAAPAVVGASLDPGGQPRLVLDPVSLVAEAYQSCVPQLHAIASRPSILVVDDSLTTRMLEQSILESAGYVVSLASSGEEGLERARAARYALFLVDVEMPGMDGFAFIEQIRADSSLRDIPSILVTSRAAAEDRQRGREVGAQAYIVKSEFDQGALLECIRRLVQ